VRTRRAAVVYLEVVPRTTSSSAILQGHECLVFFVGGVPTAGSRHPGTINVLLCDGSVRLVRDENELVAVLARSSLSLPTTMIVGPGTQVGFATT
jgi:prepilin-type processing-associated H-X9-DG protein